MDTERLSKLATTDTEDRQTDCQNKHCNMKRKDEGTQDDRGRDGGTNCILRIKEQETHLTLQELDDDGDDDDDDENQSGAWISVRCECCVFPVDVSATS